MTCECQHSDFNCNQGRDCPHRPHRQPASVPALVAMIAAAFFAGFLVVAIARAAAMAPVIYEARHD
jgi:hypothetical protein